MHLGPRPPHSYGDREDLRTNRTRQARVYVNECGDL